MRHNVLVLLTAAVQLNDQFLFFSGWADLRGALAGTSPTVTLTGGGAPGAADRPVGTRPS